MRESVRELVFEVSWEVCNKVGGIHTVLVGKAPYAKQRFGERYILIGPYVVQGRQNWEESNSYSEWQAYLERRHGLRVYPGIWRVGDTQVSTWLIDFHALLGRKDEIFHELWESFGVDSLWGGWDYVEPAIFGYAAGMVIASFLEFYYGEEGEVEVVAHFHEWLTGAGVLYLRRYKPAVATVFTTHATVVGRAAEGHPITQEPDRWAAERGLLAKHTLERAAWQEADVTTTVSELVGEETGAYLGRLPDVITPNGWQAPPTINPTLGKAFLQTLAHTWKLPPEEPLIWLLHSGRPELVNKGTNDLLEAIRRYQIAPLHGVKLGLSDRHARRGRGP
jgi:phosphorylase/glycogen(starch) synthase